MSKKVKIDWGIIARVFAGIFYALLIIGVAFSLFYLGYSKGFLAGESQFKTSSTTIMKSPTPLPEENLKKESEVSTPTPPPRQEISSWTGPELWEAVNKRRVELGVNPLSTRSELCTIASIRLNQLLALGTLDAHEGFSKLPEEREDLKWIFEKYNLTEFLVAGASSATEAVSLWENTLGHSKLLNGGEYVWGCTYAQNGFGVAITAY